MVAGELQSWLHLWLNYTSPLLPGTGIQWANLQPHHLPCHAVLFKDLQANSSASVTAYSVESAVLRLEHCFPAASQPVAALVDVRLVMERIGPLETRIGEWVNVLGYVAPMPADAKGKRAPNLRASEVPVQALLLWSAGPLNVHDYERRFVEREFQEDERIPGPRQV